VRHHGGIDDRSWLEMLPEAGCCDLWRAAPVGGLIHRSGTPSQA